MFGRQQVVQMVSLDDLARFIQQVMPQGKSGTTITVYIQELHIHASGEQVEFPALSGGRWPELQERSGIEVVDSPWSYPPTGYTR